jgi:16S rRNA (guanine966-N2)-methyltransferase
MNRRPPPISRSRPIPSWGRGVVRIIGGQWKRTPIAVSDTPGLRPTPDRVRETTFNWLTHIFDGTLKGRSILDLFAGTGALGLEAASRGADLVMLVESNRVAADAIQAVGAKLKARQVHVRSGDAIDIAQLLLTTGQSFDVVFLDPPFGQGMLVKAFPYAAMLCKASGVIYAEAEAALDQAILAGWGLEILRADKAGEVFYHLLRRINNE